MQDICCKLSRLAAVVVMLMVSCVGSAWAQGGVPWQVGDIVVCYGGGKCNVIRLHGGTVQLLDTISSNLLGNNGGVGLNNTLHVLATDDKGGGSSKVVVYSIASVNPFSGQPLTHTVINNPLYDGSGSGNGSAAALAVGNNGHLFVGNSNPASIVELNADGTTTGNIFTFPTSGDCATTTLKSLDLSAAGNIIYVTAGDGIIRKVSVPFTPNGCSQFANFGALVNLYGIKDVPAGALSGSCGSGSCPTGESVLVVAKGFTDPDANETSEPSPNDPDAVNICTNLTDQLLVSCGLLLDTAGAGLNAQAWVAGKLYNDTNTTILDPHGHVQQVLTPGTAGGDEPAFGQSTTTIDNAVKWTDLSPQPSRTPNHPYLAGALPGPSVAAVPDTYIVDSHGNLETVTIAGTSGPNEPTWPQSGTTIDGLVWTDQGPTVTWTAGQYYALNSLLPINGHVQKVTVAGTAGSSQPAFSTNTGTVADGAVTWSDQGRPTWQPGTGYAQNALVIDANGNIEEATTGGTSQTPGPPSWNPTVGGTTNDGDTLVWTNEGQPRWAANAAYPLSAFILDTVNHLQVVTVSGTSASTQPTFNEAGGTTVDGLMWTDQGPYTSWTMSNLFQLNQLIVEGAAGDQHVQKVTEAGTSGTSAPTPFNHSFSTTIDNAVTWTESHPSRVASTVYVLNAIVLDSPTAAAQVQQVSLAGTTGTADPFTGFKHDGTASDPDGLQWTDQPNPSVLARYPVTGVTTLQSLALDPLVANCTGSNGTACSSGSLPTRIVTDSNQSVTPSFWMGGTAGGTIYRLDFANGTPVSFDAQTGNTGIQSMVVYGGESANQPGLASLVVNGALNSGDFFTASPNFLGNSIKSTLSNNSGGSPPSTAISLYASAVDSTSCFNDPSVGSIGCKPFSSNPSRALVLKIDIPLNGNGALPTTQTLNTAITPPTGFFDNGTDVFVDEQFDDTTFVGGDPGTRTVSVHSLHEVNFQFGQGQSQCAFSSPLPNTCYKLNRTTLNFTFSCPGLQPTQVASLRPVLSLVKKTTGQAPQFINITGATATNGKPAFRYNSTSNFWTYQLNLTGFAAGTYLGTAFDLSNQVQSFTTQTFTLSNTCK